MSKTFNQIMGEYLNGKYWNHSSNNSDWTYG